jgi:hypothetical protein
MVQLSVAEDKVAVSSKECAVGHDVYIYDFGKKDV